MSSPISRNLSIISSFLFQVRLRVHEKHYEGLFYLLSKKLKVFYIPVYVFNEVFCSPGSAILENSFPDALYQVEKIQSFIFYLSSCFFGSFKATFTFSSVSCELQ